MVSPSFFCVFARSEANDFQFTSRILNRMGHHQGESLRLHLMKRMRAIDTAHTFPLSSYQ